MLNSWAQATKNASAVMLLFLNESLNNDQYLSLFFSLNTFWHQKPLRFFYVDGCHHKSFREKFSQLSPENDRELSLPSITLVDLENEKFFNYNSELTVAALNDFLRDFYDGKLQEAMISQNENQITKKEGPLQSLTANTFHQVYTNKTNFVVLFYLQWCGFCKTAQAILEDLSFENSSTSTIFAAYNVAENTLPNLPFKLEKFPAIVLFANQKQGETQTSLFEGVMSKENLKHLSF